MHFKSCAAEGTLSITANPSHATAANKSFVMIDLNE